MGLEHVKKYPDASLEASFYNMIGNIKREQNDYKGALDNYIKAVKLFEQQKNLRGLTQALSNVGKYSQSSWMIPSERSTMRYKALKRQKRQMLKVQLRIHTD